ncbi:hypothetical protein P7F88_10370 [Vibrio hannami]|uniref:hypothetical protein n=1 Tax=Vibrio hannami TaxID=2717094 RepID=UPI00240F37FA|nr:hypothetical protein [Vibrio hannami]MDG3086495.1 hypothetical protein [Vibrio hannami]
MKKLTVASAVLAAITASSAFADTSVEVYSDRSTSAGNFFEGAKGATQGVVIGHSPMENLGLAAEFTTNKEIDLGVAYKFDVTENFYVKPQLGYVVKFKDGYADSWDDLPPLKPGDYTRLTIEDPNSDVVKAGLEAGAAFGEFFASARYRIDFDIEADKISGTNVKNGASTNFYKEKSRIGRTDLMVGYNMEAVTLTAKAIHKSQLNKDIRSINSTFGDTNSFWTSEVKATLTNFDSVAPYVQFARNHDTKDNQIKLGAKFAF